MSSFRIAYFAYSIEKGHILFIRALGILQNYNSFLIIFEMFINKNSLRIQFIRKNQIEEWLSQMVDCSMT